MLDGNKVYRVGEPENYTSIYGYPKRRFPIIEVASGITVATAKEEEVPGTPGKPTLTCYYTKSNLREHGQLRFYQSPDALVLAFGGQIDLAKVKPKVRKTAKKKTPARAKARTKTVVKPHRRVKKLAA